MAPLFVELCRDRRIPLRGFSGITYVGNFYGQWEHGKTDLQHISPEYLIVAPAAASRPGFSELACHPGDRDARFDPMYDWQRRFELDALTDPRVSAAVTRRPIRLIELPGVGSGGSCPRRAQPRRHATRRPDAGPPPAPPSRGRAAARPPSAG